MSQPNDALYSRLGRLEALGEANAELLREIRDQVRDINGRVGRAEGRIAHLADASEIATRERASIRILAEDAHDTLALAKARDGVVLTRAQLRTAFVFLTGLVGLASGLASLAVKLWL